MNHPPQQMYFHRPLYVNTANSMSSYIPSVVSPTKELTVPVCKSKDEKVKKLKKQPPMLQEQYPLLPQI